MPCSRHALARCRRRSIPTIPRANTMTLRHKSCLVAIGLTLPLAAAAREQQPAVDAVTVSAKVVERQIMLPGELLPYLAVPIFAKVNGFVKAVNVDRGSEVRQGQVLATLEAPELIAQVAEAQAKAQALELQRAEGEARLAAARSTYDRLKAASATPGAVADNDVIVAEK